VASATVGTAEQNALTVTVDPRTNSLLVGGTDHYVNLVAEIIQQLDASPAHERKTEVYRMRNGKASEVALAIRSFLDQDRQRTTAVLGADAVGTAQRMLEREVAVVAEPASNTLLISTNPRYFDEVKQLIADLDQPQAQVMIQVLLAEVLLDNQDELGVEWTYYGDNGATKYGIGTRYNLTGSSGFPTPVPAGGMSGLAAAVTGSDYSFLVRALHDQGRLQVLSRPQILTADNQPAVINVGKRVPVITDSRVTPQGDSVNSFKYEDIGVNLSVTPKISPDGFVRMEVGTTNSDLSTSTVDIPSGDSSIKLPIIIQRRANTTVSVQSGQTVIIGGLIGTLDDIRTTKIPVLGDIPGLGVLFRSRTKTTERRELLIFLTPQVLLTPESAKALMSDQVEGSQFRTRIKRDELQKRLLDPLIPELPPTGKPGPKSNAAPPPEPVVPKQST
jgi:type II secretion system protein D